MESWYTWEFSGVGVAVASTALTFFKTKAKCFSGIRFLERNEIDYKIGTVEERLSKATNLSCISGNDYKYTAETCSAHINAILKRGVKVRFIATNPTPEISKILATSGPRFHNSDQFKASTTEVLKRFKDWKENYRMRLTTVYYPFCRPKVFSLWML